jgi:hypothetical protein
LTLHGVDSCCFFIFIFVFHLLIPIQIFCCSYLEMLTLAFCLSSSFRSSASWYGMKIR